MDTTCGSVLNVWKNVKRYAEEGFTSVIHGKYWHEETRATASQALPGRPRSLSSSCSTAPRPRPSATTSGTAATAPRSSSRFEHAVSPGFDPDAHLQRVGCANQTTMLSSESLEIGEMFRHADRATGTARQACRSASAPSTRSAARPRIARTRSSQLLDERPLDLMMVLGGYNSSNTCNLARICAERVPTYHIADPDGLRVERRNSAQTRAWQAGNDHDGLAAAGPARRRPDVGRLDAGQPGRGRDPAPGRADQPVLKTRRRDPWTPTALPGGASQDSGLNASN